jgi:hypothetical protein
LNSKSNANEGVSQFQKLHNRHERDKRMAPIPYRRARKHANNVELRVVGFSFCLFVFFSFL